MDDIESAFNDLLSKLEKKCPIFIPSIFPQKISLNSLNDLLYINQNENSHEIEYFESLSSTIPFIVFCTSISYSSRFITITDVKPCNELDFLLARPEKIMNTILKGSDSEIQLLAERLLELNEYDVLNMEKSEIRRTFNEVYHLVYAIRILISNTPGFQVIICEEVLPLRNFSDDLKEFLNNRLVTGLNNNNDYDNDEDHDDNEEQQAVKKVKKNKRKRGKKG